MTADIELISLRGAKSEMDRFRRWIGVMMLRMGVDIERGEREKRERDFVGVIRAHESMIKKICYGYSRNTDELADLYQDCLINIWDGLFRFRGESNIRTWIYRVSLNTCVSTLRRRKKEDTKEDLLEAMGLATEDVEAKSRIESLHAAIQTLGDMDKAIVMMWLDEYRYEEIADTVGLPRNTVATRLKRAKEKIKKNIDI